mmetsp:Transcript_37875/g.65727  ORF Transcript_37875/g.65727 Transcript_37875/m.65727 type:complete len:225 (-) Transcript_37875:202-876(-)
MDFLVQPNSDLQVGDDSKKVQVFEAYTKEMQKQIAHLSLENRELRIEMGKQGKVIAFLEQKLAASLQRLEQAEAALEGGDRAHRRAMAARDRRLQELEGALRAAAHRERGANRPASGGTTPGGGTTTPGRRRPKSGDRSASLSAAWQTPVQTSFSLRRGSVVEPPVWTVAEQASESASGVGGYTPMLKGFNGSRLTQQQEMLKAEQRLQAAKLHTSLESMALQR